MSTRASQQARLGAALAAAPHSSRTPLTYVPFYLVLAAGAKDCVPAALLNTVLGSLSASEHRAGFNSPALHRLNALGDTAHKNVCSTVREYSTLASAAPGSPTSPLHLHLRDTSYVIPGPIATALCARHDVLCAVLVVATQLTDTAQWRELQWQDTAVVPPEAHGSRVGLWLYLCTHLPKRPSYYDADLCATYDDVRNIWIFTCSPLSVTLTPAAAARAARITTNVAAARGSQVVHPAQVDICVGRVCAFCAKKVRHMSASISEWYQRTYMATGLTPADGMRLVQHCHLKLCKDKVCAV